MTSKIFNPNFKYHTADESRDPGYLRRKFDKMRRRHKAKAREKKEEHVAVVRSLRTGTGGKK